ncbi:MAG: hypothetical protein KJ971_08730 [Firmicutes bacterium]|nr:hypothetical protein [Bacillota bacterium]
MEYLLLGLAVIFVGDAVFKVRSASKGEHIIVQTPGVGAIGAVVDVIIAALVIHAICYW